MATVSATSKVVTTFSVKSYLKPTLVGASRLTIK
jgi:hypothetical protein